MELDLKVSQGLPQRLPVHQACVGLWFLFRASALPIKRHIGLALRACMAAHPNQPTVSLTLPA